MAWASVKQMLPKENGAEGLQPGEGCKRASVELQGKARLCKEV